jgi:hypothetical protein
MGFVTEVTNSVTGKRYLISTAEVEILGTRVWQTAVFKQRLGPLAGMFRPALFVGAAETSRARIQHERVEAIVQNIKPTDWEEAKWRWFRSWRRTIKQRAMKDEEKRLKTRTRLTVRVEIMRIFFTRFSDMLTPLERERLAELKKNGLPQYIRGDVDMAGTEYWKIFTMASAIAAHICLGEPFERQQEVTELLELNQKKSRRRKIFLAVVLPVLFWLGVLYAVVKLASWLF